MRLYEVGIRLLFWADDEAHAVEQFVDAVDDVAAWTNHVEEASALTKGTHL